MADSEMRSMKAAVTRAKGAAFQIEDVRIGAPRHDEVLVRVVACGVCHTDIVVRDQDFQSPLPAILGHEGAGVVEAVGENVHRVAPGDHVVMSYMFCGECYLCDSGHPAHCLHVGPINFGGGRLDGSTSAEDAKARSSTIISSGSRRSLNTRSPARITW